MFCDLTRPLVTQGSLRTEGYHLGRPEGDRTVHLRLGTALSTRDGSRPCHVRPGSWSCHQRVEGCPPPGASCGWSDGCLLPVTDSLRACSPGSEVRGGQGRRLATRTALGKYDARKREALGRLARSKGDRVHGFRSLRNALRDDHPRKLGHRRCEWHTHHLKPRPGRRWCLINDSEDGQGVALPSKAAA